jgi:hypothetical protein
MQRYACVTPAMRLLGTDLRTHLSMGDGVLAGHLHHILGGSALLLVKCMHVSAGVCR